MAVGLLGGLAASVRFVRVTIPENHGSNPGYGVYEVAMLPWFIAFLGGLGLTLDTFRWTAALFLAGFFALGFLGQLLSRTFRGSGPDERPTDGPGGTSPEESAPNGGQSPDRLP